MSRHFNILYLQGGYSTKYERVQDFNLNGLSSDITDDVAVF